MAVVYPTLPDLYGLTDAELLRTYTEIRQWADAIVNELEGRDLDSARTGTVRINRAVSSGCLLYTSPSPRD